MAQSVEVKRLKAGSVGVVIDGRHARSLKMTSSVMFADAAAEIAR